MLRLPRVALDVTLSRRPVNRLSLYLIRLLLSNENPEVWRVSALVPSGEWLE
jgi:hypothetical protein